MKLPKAIARNPDTDIDPAERHNHEPIEAKESGVFFP